MELATTCALGPPESSFPGTRQLPVASVISLWPAHPYGKEFKTILSPDQALQCRSLFLIHKYKLLKNSSQWLISSLLQKKQNEARLLKKSGIWPIIGCDDDEWKTEMISIEAWLSVSFRACVTCTDILYMPRRWASCGQRNSLADNHETLSHFILTREKNFLVTQCSDDPLDNHSRGHGTFTYTWLFQN